MTTVINFFAGPGAGKSTTAARLFTELKIRGIKCELVTEFAKDLTWEQRSLTLSNQLYILAKQHHRMFRVYAHGVDYVITDSPLLLGLHYAKLSANADYISKLRPLILHLHNETPTVNFFIERTKPYQQYGRSQNEEEARGADDSLRNILTNENIPFTSVHTGPEGMGKILNTLGIDSSEL